MKHRKWGSRICAGVLVSIVLAGVALAAGGSQTDPLVTLSYLTDQATPAILAQVDKKIAQREGSLSSQLSAIAEQYVQQVESALAGGSGDDNSGQASYQVLYLTQGQQVIGSEGCEFLLRAGTAACISDSAPGLIDMTDGSTLANGGSLVRNHLYLSTIDGRGVSAATDITLLVRGGYTVS